MLSRNGSAALLLALLAGVAFAQPPLISDSKPVTPLAALLPPPKPCPAGTTFAGIDEMQYEGAVYGHFQAQDSDDAIVSAIGCEPHASGYGGSYLLTRKSGAWQVVWYKPAILTTVCKKIRLSDNRDGLLCHVADIGQGVVTEALYTLDVGQRQPQPNLFFTATDNTGAFTSMGRGPMTAAKIDKVELAGTKLTVTAKLGMQRRYRRRQVDPAGDPPIPMTPFHLEFLFNGTSFTPAPGSVREAALFAR